MTVFLNCIGTVSDVSYSVIAIALDNIRFMTSSPPTLNFLLKFLLD